MGANVNFTNTSKTIYSPPPAPTQPKREPPTALQQPSLPPQADSGMSNASRCADAKRRAAGDQINRGIDGCSVTIFEALQKPTTKPQTLAAQQLGKTSSPCHGVDSVLVESVVLIGQQQQRAGTLVEALDTAKIELLGAQQSLANASALIQQYCPKGSLPAPVSSSASQSRYASPVIAGVLAAASVGLLASHLTPRQAVKACAFGALGLIGLVAYSSL